MLTALDSSVDPERILHTKLRSSGTETRVTVHGVCPSRTWWLLEVMAGLAGDWNSQPHTVSSVCPSGGAVRGKNCVDEAERTTAPP
ncbi:hypothetical protein EYF80_022461 [Liparis tanakae]|uniref:Uncharacterized protein n=1 Tax=Liparis tanakae TaxID=230148 RepID=A0A4Z2HQU9_9TELE|nr:hypothetical protein EYF80_022461 [Liparis tanakae]